MTSTPLRPTRRSLVRGAAWSVPVVAVAAAAPAFAASPCSDTYDYALDWGNTAKTTYSAPTATTGNSRVGSASALAPVGSGASAVGVTFTSTYVPTGQNTVDRRATDNLTVPAVTGIGGLVPAQQGLLISHASTSTTRDGFRQMVAIRFDRAVTALSFTITDIDSQTESWWDRIELTGSRTATFNNTIIEGAGIQGNSWRTVNGNNSIATNSPDGNVTVTYGSLAADAITDITLTFWSTVSGQNQLVRLSDFSFKAKGC